MQNSDEELTAVMSVLALEGLMILRRFGGA